MVDLAIQDSSKALKLGNDLTVNIMDELGVTIPLIGVDPPNVSHGGVIASHVELIFEAYWKAMQRTNDLSVPLEMTIEIVCLTQRVFKENLMQAIALWTPSGNTPTVDSGEGTDEKMSKKKQSITI